MRLILDIGNTLYKLAVYDRDNMVFHTSVSHFKPNDFLRLDEEYIIESVIVSSVRNGDGELMDLMSKEASLMSLDYDTPLPINNKYSSKQTLGRDRIAAVVGASRIFPGRNVLVIDAGTCITYDFINNNNEYLGGAISPGLRMRFKALNKFTGRLPVVELKGFEMPDLIGDTTDGSILSGVINGLSGEINGFINSFKSNNNQLETIITGGDHKYFDKLFKYKTFAAPFLVLDGLKGILDFNERN
ncbi:MAG: type III pantothenate kinase [Chlorobi bacterium]|nr:type III pantothenate kinase [Chlorobiota bacterium]